jgi:hypothetical protein
MVDQTRRRVLKLFGAAGALTSVGGVGMATAQDTPDEDEMRGMIEDLSDGGVQTSRVRVGHFIPDGPEVDVYAFVPGFEEVGAVPIITGLDYGQVQPNIPAEYADVPALSIGLKVTPAGKPDEPVVKVPKFDFEAGRNYTLLAIGEIYPELEQPMPQAFPLVDNEGEDPAGYGRTQLPESDETLVRFAHVLADGGRVSVHCDGDTVASGLRFGNATDYIEVDPDDELRISRSGEPAKTITGGLEDGVAYTVYVSERQPEAGGFKPKVFSTVDAVARPDLETSDH